MARSSKKVRSSVATVVSCVALFAALSGAFAGFAAPAESDAARMALAGSDNHVIPACATCHGPAGAGDLSHGAPRLAHLNADYLARQLEAFATGARKSDQMRPIATRLSPDQRQLMGQYYARLSPVVTAGSFDAERLEHGKVLAEIGDWSVQAPPCASCHGSRGTGVGSVTPPLAGQTQAYLLAQLKRFRSGERKSDTLGLMNGIARRLSNNDLRAAAAYYGSLAIPGSERQAAGAAK